LREDPALRRAARQLSAGAPLSLAVTSAGYAAAQSAALHLSGAPGDSELARLLAREECGTLTDPHLLDVGALRRGGEVWVVLGAPAALPNTRRADLVRGEILALVNRARERGRRCGNRTFGAAPPLSLNAALTSAAQAHSEEMAVQGVFDHRGSDGSSPSVRVARAGYGPHRIVGENIAAGAMTPAEVTAGWLDSPAHCENIMDPRFSEIGIAFAVNTASASLVYWTQDFATP
jgi:uncharacterized protein YkwD